MCASNISTIALVVSTSFTALQAGLCSFRMHTWSHNAADFTLANVSRILDLPWLCAGLKRVISYMLEQSRCHACE